MENEKLFVTNRASSAILAFEEKMNEKYKNTNNKYFKEYLLYNMAALKDGVSTNKIKIFETIFQKKAVNKGNYEYMSLFRQYYRKRFKELALKKDGLEFLSAVNGTSSYSKLMNIVKTDPYIPENDTLAELFILNGFFESYHDKSLFKKHKVLAMLSYIETHGINRQNSQ